MNKKITIETPALYGDHHVIEVRQQLLALEGVEDVYASSAFRIVEVTFDEDKVKEEKILGKLDELGYTGEWQFPEELGMPTYLESDRSQSYFRHTDVFETTREVVSFAQNVSYTGRPLWSCPGFGVIKSEMED